MKVALFGRGEVGSKKLGSQLVAGKDLIIGGGEDDKAWICSRDGERKQKKDGGDDPIEHSFIVGGKLGVVKKREMCLSMFHMEENQEKPVAKKGTGMGVVLGIVGLVVVVGGLLMLKNSKTQSAKTQIIEEVVTEPTAVPAGVVMEESGAVKELAVEGSPFEFKPKEMRVKKGDTVRVTFENMKGTHDFVIDEFNVRTNQIGEGEEEEVEFVADKAGTFEYYCSVDGHRAQGMKGSLIVE